MQRSIDKCFKKDEITGRYQVNVEGIKRMKMIEITKE